MGLFPLDCLVVAFFGIIAIINTVRHVANFIKTMRFLNKSVMESVSKVRNPSEKELIY